VKTFRASRAVDALRRAALLKILFLRASPGMRALDSK